MSVTNINWDKNRVATAVVRGGAPILLSLANRMTLSPNQRFDPYHGFGQGEFNAGTIRRVPTYNWTLTFPANSSSVRLFRAMFEGKDDFQIVAYDSESTTNIDDVRFQLIEERFLHCRVTSMDEGYEIADIPMISFSGTALNYDFKSVGSDGITTLDETEVTEVVDGSSTVKSKVLGDGWAETNTDIRKKLLSDIW